MRIRQKGFVSILIVFIVIIIIGVVVFFALKQNSGSKPQNFDIARNNSQKTSSNSREIPDNLSLPFNVDDISSDSGILNPLGIIRHDQDKGHGHGGIDFPLKVGSQVFAVADGEIVEISESGEFVGINGDQKLVQLLDDVGGGEGWVFLYEHIQVDSNLELGQEVKEGDVIGKHILDQRTSHYQLSYAFNNLEYYQQGLCWPENLNSNDQAALDEFWEIYRNSDYALGAWRSIINDGSYSYLALFDESKFPGGIQLCYEGNTDARVPQN